jgi:DNA mismatch endonuclease, patch repair protein
MTARRPAASSPAVRKRMRATPQRDTPLELDLRSSLHRLGLRFRIHSQTIPGLRRTVDILFPKSRVAVFVDGCFWHGCPRHGTLPRVTNRQWWIEKIRTNQQRDRDTDRQMRRLGWAVIRVWEHEDQSGAARRIANLVRQR